MSFCSSLWTEFDPERYRKMHHDCLSPLKSHTIWLVWLAYDAKARLASCNSSERSNETYFSCACREKRSLVDSVEVAVDAAMVATGLRWFAHAHNMLAQPEPNRWCRTYQTNFNCHFCVIQKTSLQAIKSTFSNHYNFKSNLNININPTATQCLQTTQLSS